MRLSWNEIRARAAAFSREWSDARYERGDTQTFYNEFFEIFEESELALIVQDKTADGKESRFNKFVAREG